MFNVSVEKEAPGGFMLTYVELFQQEAWGGCGVEMSIQNLAKKKIRSLKTIFSAYIFFKKGLG